MLAWRAHSFTSTLGQPDVALALLATRLQPEADDGPASSGVGVATSSRALSLTTRRASRRRWAAECLDEAEARQLILSTLNDLGVTDVTIATDGGVAYPVGERDAYLQHTDAGCFVYGGRQWDAEARLVHNIGGPGSVDGPGT